MLDITLVWNFWQGGLAIAASSIMVIWIGGSYLSITRGYVSSCAIISDKSYFHSEEMGGPFGFRTIFTVGVILGGVLSALYNGGINYTFDLGRFEQIWGESLYIKACVLISGGFLWGYGSRMAKGCTSGNAISGLSQGSLASLVATSGFMVGGIILVHIIHYFAGLL